MDIQLKNTLKNMQDAQIMTSQLITIPKLRTSIIKYGVLKILISVKNCGISLLLSLYHQVIERYLMRFWKSIILHNYKIIGWLFPCLMMLF